MNNPDHQPSVSLPVPPGRVPMLAGHEAVAPPTDWAPPEVATRPGDDDLTARARILAAAVHGFGTTGVEGTTIRDIAVAAGVSVGLIHHHFGSKARLRDAADDALLAAIDRSCRLSDAGGSDDTVVARALSRIGVPMVRYLAQGLACDSSAAARAFDRLAAHQDAALSNPGDPRTTGGRHPAYVADITAMQAGRVLLWDHVQRNADTPRRSDPREDVADVSAS